MREQYSPRVSKPLVKFDWPGSCLGLKIRSNAAGDHKPIFKAATFGNALPSKTERGHDVILNVRELGVVRGKVQLYAAPASPSYPFVNQGSDFNHRKCCENRADRAIAWVIPSWVLTHPTHVRYSTGSLCGLTPSWSRLHSLGERDPNAYLGCGKNLGPDQAMFARFSRRHELHHPIEYIRERTCLG